MLLPIGYDNFREIIDNKLDFIDKSLFIKDVIDDITAKVVVILRPRRFGKTLNLSMLHHFLASEVNGLSTKGLFEHLKILQSGEAYTQHQGRHPVIFITFKDIKSNDFTSACDKLYELFLRTYNEHAYLETSSKLTTIQRKRWNTFVDDGVRPSQLEGALQFLSECLFTHHGVRPWLLIDEYDTPILSAYANNYYDEMIVLMRGLLGAALKTNPYLHKAVITGILRVAKESLFSGLNNLKVYSLLNEKYSEYFGFTESEVDTILKKSNLSDKSAEIKQWYNGYQIGDTVIYNPWSIANCVNERILKPYWINTSDNNLIKDLLKQSPLSFKQAFESLIQGETTKQVIDEGLAFQYLNHNPTAVWSLLLMSGYLKPVSKELVVDGVMCELAVPNFEVATLYWQIIKQWLSNGYGIEWYNQFISALLSGDIEKFQADLEKVLLQIASYHDLAKEPEAFFHGLFLGFSASLHSVGTYEVSSNREAGHGRYDIMLFPKDKTQLGIVIEFKNTKDENAPLLQLAKAALKQIDEKNYTSEFHHRGLQKILKIGIGFSGKFFELVSEKTSL